MPQPGPLVLPTQRSPRHPVRERQQITKVLRAKPNSASYP